MPMTFVKPEVLNLKTHPELTEKWVQERIAEDPTILGLGDLLLRDKERSQPKAGRLDLLLQDSESKRRYEVEIQLGALDESHLIRTLEYWDIERKRYPQYDHCAVIVAEELTSCFLNVIGLFNSAIPLVAIQMRALRIGEQVALTFTTVLDELTRGLEDEDEPEPVVTNRAWWENQSSKEIVSLADQCLVEWIKPIAPDFELKYNKNYIGVARQGKSCGFVIFRAKNNGLRMEVRMMETTETTAKLEAAGLDFFDYFTLDHRYRIRVRSEDLETKREALRELLKASYEAFIG